MSPQAERLLVEALKLDPPARRALAFSLLDSVGEEDQAVVRRLWAEEIARREEALRGGAEQAIPWEQVRAELDAL
jgi:putative addiction module component (TIGR02574 family)